MNDQYGTGILTPEQAQQQSQQRSGLNSRLGQQRYQYEMGKDDGTKSKSKSLSKNLINIAFIIILLAGVLGSFIAAFDMDKFVSFLEVFAYVWAPLVVAVGGGRAMKNWTEKRYHAKAGQTPIQNVEQPPE